MNQVAHLKTARVTGYEPDGSAIIERQIIKLAIGPSFNNFLKHIKLKNFMAKEPPVIVKALGYNGKAWVEIKKDEFQAQLKKALGPVSPLAKGETTDYKAISEEQAKQLATQNELLTKMAERLDSLEKAPAKLGTTIPAPADDFEEPIIDKGSEGSEGAETTADKLRAKADSLKIAYSSNIGDATLLKRIQEIEPNFNV